MDKVRLVKTSYTLPNGNRAIEAGVYKASFFNKEETKYLRDRECLVDVDKSKEGTNSQPSKLKFGKSKDQTQESK